MATGDQADVSSRLTRRLPASWFGSAAAKVTALLQAPAWALSWLYSLYAYAKLQTRIATATDGFLDLVALDYFGTSLQRLSGEADAAFRTRIMANLLHPGTSRAAMISVLTSYTGRAPRVFEPARPTDTGAYNGYYIGYNQAGGYTNPALIPGQALVTIYRGNNVPDAQLYAAAAAVQPAATEVWVALSN